MTRRFWVVRRLSAHGMTTFAKLKSGSWRTQVRRKGKYVGETFLRRKDAEQWALEVEHRNRPAQTAVAAKARDAKTFGDLVRLYREDLQEVGNRIGRSKSASLAFLEADSGAFCRSLIENV